MVRITDNYENLASLGIKVPKRNVYKSLVQNTEERPTWVHFGGGNLFRCMQAAEMQSLIDQELVDTGIILAETWDDGLIEQVYNSCNNRTIDVILKSDGSFDLELINSVAKALYVNANDEKGKTGFEYLKTVFANPSLQLVTFTVTEKGYNIKDLKGEYFPPVAAEVESGPGKPQSLMGVIASLLLERYQNGQGARIALLSTDNFSHNGDKLKSSVLEIARAWEASDAVDDGFIDYISDSTKVSFPFSMIDRITPSPSITIASELSNLGLENMNIIKTEKFSNSAPFVNTEETNYLVVEDNFPNGRPPLEKAGVIFTTKEKVDEVERMKVCTCLNPLHTALAVFGCLLGFNKISEEVLDGDLLALINKIGYEEGMKVVTDPGIVNPKQFIKEVIEDRLPNPYIPDTPQRIATDTSQKLPIRFGVTISLYDQRDDLDVSDLDAIPLVFAAWLRYLTSINDAGEEFDRSPDPMLEQLDLVLGDIKLGDDVDKLSIVKPYLKDKNIFGVDLEEVGLADKVFAYYVEMMSGTSKVRGLLHKIAN